MREWKKGDKVEYVGDTSPDRIGDKGVVQEVDSYQVRGLDSYKHNVILDIMWKHGDQTRVYERNVKLLHTLPEELFEL